MDKKLVATAVGSFVGTAAFYTVITTATIVSKKIDRARRVKREENTQKETQKN